MMLNKVTLFHKFCAVGFFLLCMFFVFPVKGQTGPFGIGNATGADGQPKLLLWLDGSTVATPVDSDVLLWSDKSGNGNDFTATASTSPILRSGGPQGNNFLEFSKADNRMVSASPITFSSSGVTIYYVFRTSDSDYSLFSFAESDSNPDKILTREVGGVNSLTIDGNQHNTTQGDLSNNTWRHAGFIWGNNSNPTYWHRSNGSSSPELTQNSVLTGEVSAATGTAVIGHVQTLLDGGYISGEEFDGDLAEIIVYDGKLNKSMLRMMNTYFRTKYEIGGTGGWDKLNTPNSYREESLGIGRDGGSASEHLHSNQDGLVLRANPGGLLGTYDYLSGAHNVGSNSIVTSNVTGAVEARWSRIWFMRESSLNGSSQVQVAFDFGEGINGDFPSNADNYELLYRSGTSGNFTPRTVLEKSILDDQIVFRVTGSQLPSTGYYTLGTTDQANSSLDGQVIRTWYAYQSGNWSNPSTWTLDGSAAPFYINPDSETPASGDAIVIASGRTVTMDVNNRNQQKLDLQGNLDVATSSGHTFSFINGDGLIRCEGSGGVGNFPAGNTTNFADALTGGAVEFYGSGFTLPNDILVNKLRLNLNSSSSEVVLLADLTHNGRFDVERGTFRVNNTVNTSREITSNDDVIVSSQGRIKTSAASGQTIHVWNFEADLVNNGGQVIFTNRTTPAYTSTESSDWILARFISQEQNQALVANGVTNFSRLVMNKGNDMTYVLTVSSNNANHFKLLGRCNYNMPNSDFTSEAGNNNSCALVNGTFEVGEDIFIPLHAGTGNYNINNTVMLWVNGGQVSKGAPDVGSSNTQAIVPYGIVKVSEGILNAYCKSGLTTRDNGVIQIDGGEVNTNQIRTSVFGADNIGGIIINGGSVNIDGTLPGGTNGSYYTLSLTYSGNLFRMTGGTLRVAGPSSKGLVFINSDPEQTSVTGGSIICEIKNTSNNHKLTSTAPLWNLEVERTNTSGTNRPLILSGGDSFGEVIADLPLQIKNNLIIDGANETTLRAYSTSNNDVDVYIQGGLTIENGAIYDHFQNTTFFDGNASSLLALPTGNTQTFHNLVVQKSEESRFAKIQSGNGTRAVEVQGDFEVLSGSFDNSNRHVTLLGDVVLNRQVGEITSTGIVYFEGVSAQTISSTNGIFHNVRFDNASGITLEDGDLISRGNLRLLDGIFDLGSNKLRIEGENGLLSNVSGASASKCFITDGSASAGGLEVVFRTTSQSLLYPIGVDDGGTVRYTPSFTRINGDYVDDGYIRVVPVNSELPTADDGAGGDKLDFFWRVSHSDFENLPRVSHFFIYDNSDVSFDENNFVAGRVLNDNPFSREIDSLNVATDHVSVGSNRLYFNGITDGGSATGGTGRTIANADYSAGFRDRFLGRPEVFYSRSTTYNAAWNNFNNWSELAMFGPGDGPFQYHSSSVPNTNSNYPQEGDIAFIGFNPTNGKPHVYEAPAGGIEATAVEFTPLQDNMGNRLARYEGIGAANITVLRPTLSFSASSEIEDIGQISGEGVLLIDADVDMGVTDIGDFLVEDSSIVMLQSPMPLMTMSSFPSAVPNLFITSNNNGSNNFSVEITSNVLVRGDMEIAGNANYRLATGSKGDVIVQGDLILAKYQASTSGPQLSFGNSGNPRRFDVLGDLSLTGSNGLISVASPNATAPVQYHEMSVYGNIYQNTSGGTDGLKFFTDDTSDDITLNLKGAGVHSYQNDGGDAPYLGRLIMDKGIDISSSFLFDSDVELDPAGLLTGKSIELLNGLLKFDDSGIDITLSNGGGAYFIPNSSGIELGNGTLSLKGLDTGVILDGLLKVTSGDFVLGGAPNENNYLEYSAGGTASIELSGGNIFVGSQLRRGLTNTQGVLKYQQSGGKLTLGVYDAPNADRGMFEIVNNGSEFNFTGGEIEFVRGVNSTSTPSLLLEPDLASVSGTGIIQIGNTNSPSGAQINNFGLKSNVSISTLRVDNSSGNNPLVKLFNTSLKISNYLEIDADATFDCQFLDLTIQGDVLNDGLLTSTSGHVFLDHSTVANVSGTGVYNLYDLTRTGGGNTTVSSSINVASNFFMDSGQMDFGTFVLNVKGDANIDGNLLFDVGSEGLHMDGSGSQILRRTNAGESNIDILTTDNPSGIGMIPGAGYTFTIGKELRMKRGVFDLKGNLLKIASAGDIVQVNAFGESNMISTGGAFTNFGVEKIVPANSSSDVFIPLGIDRFMPVRLILSDVGFTSGTQESTYLFRLNIPSHPVVQEIPNAPDPEIVDVQNVLQLWHSVEVTGVGANLLMDIEFGYDDEYVAVTSPYSEADYIAARVVNNSPNPDVFKFLGAVDDGVNVYKISFNNVTSQGISGDYFAGIESAIPDNVPVYTTTRDGDVNEGGVTGVYDNVVPGGGSPSGAVVVIDDGHELTLNVDGVNLYKTVINANAVLNIDATAFHRIGIVEGTGTIRLNNTGSLPSGIYNEFFSCTGGKLEYAGNENYEVLANLPIIREVTFSGSGERQVSNNDIQVCENVLVNGPSLKNEIASNIIVDGDLNLNTGSFENEQGNLTISGDLNVSGGLFSATSSGVKTIEGDINQSGGAFDVGTGGSVDLFGNYFKSAGTLDGGSASSIFKFTGTALQHIEGDFTGSNSFYALEMNNAAGLQPYDNIDVSNRLVLTNGNIFTGVDSLIHLDGNNVDVEPTGGSANSFIDGPMNWSLNSAGNGTSQHRVFPVGNNDRFRPLKLAFRSASRTWTVSYTDTTARINPEVISMDPTDVDFIETVSIQEFWKVNSNTGSATTARVGLSWGDSSAVSPNPSDYQLLETMAYNEGLDTWDRFGGTSFSSSDGGATGTFLSTSNTSFTERIFTLGSQLAINPLPVSWFNFDGETDGVMHTLIWATASELNNSHFVLERSIDAEHWSVIAELEGAGNSTEQLNYSFKDRMAPKGRSYYRIKQVDYDGQEEYAPQIVSLLRSQSAGLGSDEVRLFPNPNRSGSVRVLIPALSDTNAQISVSSMNGRLINQSIIYINSQGVSESINCQYTPGVYLINVYNDSGVWLSKLVISP